MLFCSQKNSDFIIPMGSYQNFFKFTQETCFSLNKNNKTTIFDITYIQQNVVQNEGRKMRSYIDVE